jgi:uncharacterized damage-inducible protein DinB
MTPQEARIVANVVGQQLQSEWMTTYKVLKAVPEESKTHQPEANSRTAWDLATHIAASDIWFLDGVLAGKFAMPNEEAQAPTCVGVAEWYKKEFPNRLERVLALPDHKLSEIVEMFGVKLPAVQFLVFTLVHMVHHRGQLSTYLRPMGGKVPSIYGGSFDEPWQGSAGTSS